MLVLRSFAPCLFLAGLVACSGESAPEAPPAPSVTEPAAPAAPATTEAPAAPAAPAGDEAALATFKAQIEVCNEWNVKVGNSAPGQKSFDGGPNDPTRTLKVAELTADKAVIEDADGNRLVLDLATKTVANAVGATEPLPMRYSFCPPEIFLGPSHD